MPRPPQFPLKPPENLLDGLPQPVDLPPRLSTPTAKLRPRSFPVFTQRVPPCLLR